MRPQWAHTYGSNVDNLFYILVVGKVRKWWAGSCPCGNNPALERIYLMRIGTIIPMSRFPYIVEMTGFPPTTALVNTSMAISLPALYPCSTGSVGLW